jgi:xylulokinase
MESFVTQPLCSLHTNALCGRSRLSFIARPRRYVRPQLKMRTRVALGVDVGTSGTKAGFVCADTGRLLALGTASHATNTTGGPFHATQLAADWMRSVADASRAAFETLVRSQSCIDVVVVAVTGSMQNLALSSWSGLEEKKGRGSSLASVPILGDGTVLLYSDARAVDAARRISKVVGWYVSPTSVLAKLALLQDEATAASDKLSPTRDWLLCLGAADYVCHILSGQPPVTDPTNASTTSLTQPPHDKYDLKLLCQAGLSCFAASLPDIRGSNHVCGIVRCEVVDQFGLPSLLSGVPIVHGGGDAATATIGAGCIHPGAGQYIYMGTSGWIGGTVVAAPTSSLGLAEKLNRAKNGVLYLGHPTNDAWEIELGSLPAAGACLVWAAQALLGGISISELERLANQANVGSNGAVFVPWISGRRCPEPDACAAGGLFGLSARVDRFDIARACIEGVAFAYRACRNIVRPVRANANNIQSLILVGGGSRLDLVAQILAGALDCSIHVRDAEAVGVIGVARYGLNIIGPRDYNDCSDCTIFSPVPCERVQFMTAWQRWSDFACQSET